MSLLVWLPLNGDSHNQGLGKYIEKANTLAYTANGKVTEKCMNSGKLVYDKNPLGKVGTICFWLYPKSAAEGNNGKSNIIFGIDPADTGGRKWSLYMFPDNKSLHTWGCQKDGRDTPNGSFTLNNVLTESTWNHVCVTHDLQKEYVYVNGNLIHTVNWDSNGTFTFDVTTPIIWSSSASDDINNFRMCDFRIYDTCLSKAEVKEIAKGKMLHYTFENPYTMETTNIPHNIVVHDNNIGEVTLGSDSTGNYINKTGMTLWSGIGIADTLVKSGRYYTWSMEVMSIKDIEYVIDGNGACNNSSHSSSNDIHYTVIRGYSHMGFNTDGTIPSSTTTLTVKGKLEAYKWTRIYFTVKMKQDCTNPKISHTFIPFIPSGDTEVKVYYRNSQLEERMYDSPYTSSKRNPLTIKDNSGMGNNGTQIYQRIEIPIVGTPVTGNSELTYGPTITSDSGTIILTNFNGTDNQCVTLGKINYNSLYHYIGSTCSYEFDLTLKDLVMASGRTLSDSDTDNLASMMQGKIHFKDGSSKWAGTPVSGCNLAQRLNNGKTSNGTFHIYYEKEISDTIAVTDANYYDLGMRFNYIKSGTIIISNLHAYYDDLDTSKLTIADKSVIGSHSLYLNGKNYINCGVVTPSMMDELTASIWLYRDDWTVKPMLPLYCSFFGVRDNGGFAIGPSRSITTLHFEVYYNSIGYLYPNDIDMTKLSTGWHLITGVANKNRIALYLDGKLYNENVHNKNAQISMLFNNDSTIARMPIYVGAELDGWGVSPTLRTVKDYYMDDVRLYATALSDKDIKALYNVKTRIDNKSNLYCNQLVETKSKNMMKPLDKVDLVNDMYKFYSSGSFSYLDGIIKYTISSGNSSYASGFYISNKNYGGPLITGERYKYDFYVKVSKAGEYLLGEEKLAVTTKTLESGKWYHIIKEGTVKGANQNFIIYNNAKNLAKGDTMEVRDIQIIRLYDTEDYKPKITKKGQYKTFELDETLTNNPNAKIVNKYNARWLQVFHHNTNNNTAWFKNEAEALHCNSTYKFSILDQLEYFRNKDGNFEFLLEYPVELPNKYNRWIQSDNPATTIEVDALNGSPAIGYTAIHVDWTSNLWGGLLKGNYSGKFCFMDGETNHANWHYAIGCYDNTNNTQCIEKWRTKMPGPDESLVTEVNLYIRIDNDNFKIYNRNTKANEIIEI